MFPPYLFFFSTKFFFIVNSFCRNSGLSSYSGFLLFIEFLDYFGPNKKFVVHHFFSRSRYRFLSVVACLDKWGIIHQRGGLGRSSVRQHGEQSSTTSGTMHRAPIGKGLPQSATPQRITTLGQQYLQSTFRNLPRGTSHYLLNSLLSRSLSLPLSLSSWLLLWKSFLRYRTIWPISENVKILIFNLVSWARESYNFDTAKFSKIHFFSMSSTFFLQFFS